MLQEEKKQPAADDQAVAQVFVFSEVRLDLQAECKALDVLGAVPDVQSDAAFAAFAVSAASAE